MERATALVWRSEDKGTGPSYDVGPGVELTSSNVMANAFLCPLNYLAGLQEILLFQSLYLSVWFLIATQIHFTKS